jgi:protein-S-isoprenylcysteine O-methyltransferase Ste14
MVERVSHRARHRWTPESACQRPGVQKGEDDGQPHAPQKAASSFVTTGIYRVSRNPMYLGMLLVLSAGPRICLTPSPGAAALFVVFINRFQIVPEERILLAKFGDVFTDYAKAVRRWV